MKIFKYIFFLINIFILTSCKYGVDFEIQNNAKNDIDSVIVTNGFNYLKFNDIKFNEKKEGFLDFKKNNPKHDGQYFLKVFTKNSIKEKPFGYYSNGGPSGSKFKIIVENDTLLINEYFD
mgnify:CR=1 FL=1|tara:strand:+ start:2108 stop:2467 length:360 start_codon:yes stop_codon:yes gene_type:complete